MTDQLPDKENSNRKFNFFIAAVTGQVGCITLLIILGAVLGGLALDRYLDTKPWFTVGLLIVSIPISLGLMIFIVKKAVAKLKTDKPLEKTSEEASIGKDS